MCVQCVPAKVEAACPSQNVAWWRCTIEVLPEVILKDSRKLTVDERREGSGAAIWPPLTIRVAGKELTPEATQVTFIGTGEGNVSLEDIDGGLEEERQRKREHKIRSFICSDTKYKLIGKDGCW